MARTAGSHSDITRPRIDAAATRLIAQYGFAAVSMRQIATEVGVQAGALYNYVPDKQTLLAELMTRHMTEILDAVQALDRGTPAKALEAFVRFHIEQNRDRSDAVFIAYMELRSLDADNFARIEALRRRYEAHLEAILKEGVARGAFEIADTRVATRALIAMLNGVNTWFRQGGALSLDAVKTLYWDMVVKAVSR